MRRGFTLVEVMAAAAILAVGCLGVLSMLMTSIDHNREARDRTTAVTLAEQTLYELEALATEYDSTSKTVGNLFYTVYKSTAYGSWTKIKSCNANGVETGKPQDDRFSVGYLKLASSTDSKLKQYIKGAIRVTWNRRNNGTSCSDFSKMDKLKGSDRDCSSITLPFALGPSLINPSE